MYMNIRRYILSLLLLCSCLAAMSAVAVPDVHSVVRQDGAVVESTDYYPYGTPFTTANSVQPYKYGTKELDRMHGLDLYDSQARWYDSLLGRTSTLDPKAERYYNLSPYTWCAGNLVRNIDENGQEYGDVFYTRDDAAIDFGKCYNGISITENVEYVTNIYIFIEPEGTVAFSYTKP